MVPCCGALISVLLTYFKLAIHTIGRGSVSIVRVVVVDCAGSIHVTRIVRITGVRGTQPPGRAEQPLPYNLFSLDFCIFPGLIYAIHELNFVLQL